MANGWQALVAPQQQKRRGGSVFEERAARRITTPLPPPFQSPDDVLRTLDHWTKRIYGGSSFLKLKSPFARLVVNLAAFHPGAQYLVEKYGPQVLKSKELVRWLVGIPITTADQPFRELRVGKVRVSIEDLMEAREKELILSDKAQRFLKEFGILTTGEPTWSQALG